jgi:hypothetical protein
MTDRSSAIPRRLLEYAKFEAGNVNLLNERAKALDTAISNFKARCTEIPTAVSPACAEDLHIHATNVGALGIFTAEVGFEFLQADSGGPTQPGDPYSESDFLKAQALKTAWQLYQDRLAWRGFFGGVRFQAVRNPGTGVTMFGRQLGGTVKEWRIFGPRAALQSMGLPGSLRRIGGMTVNARVDALSKLKLAGELFRNGPSANLAGRLTTAAPLMPAASFKTRIKGPAGIATAVTLGLDIYEYGWGENSDKGLTSREFVTSTTADVTAGLGIVAVSTAIGTCIPIPGVGTAVGFVVGVGLQYVYDRWLKDKWRDAVDAAGQAIQEGWNKASEQVGNALEDAGKKLGEAGDTVKDALSSAGDGLKSVFGFG